MEKIDLDTYIELSALITESNALLADMEGMKAHNAHMISIGSSGIYPEESFYEISKEFKNTASAMRKLIKQEEGGSE